MQLRKDVSPEKHNALEPPIKTEPQVEYKVINANCLELSDLGDDLLGAPGNEATRQILCCLEPA
jgi:hypothetical protein